jgi:GntR family transcriptional regulator
MESERLISRRQGRGTFVIDQTSTEQSLRFSNIRDADGLRIAGETESCDLAPAAATEAEARQLQLRPGEPVFRLRRVRSHNKTPLAVETSTVPQSRFPGLAKEHDVSASIVVLAHNHGMLLARAEEKLGVAAATGDIAKALKVAEGTPLLTLDCIVYAIDGRPIEWRVAHCNLRDNRYYAEIN